VDDFVVNVKQIGQYPTVGTTGVADLLLLQQNGIGGPYVSINAPDLISTALAQGGTLELNPTSAISWNGATLSCPGGRFSFSQALDVPALTAAAISVNGVAVATQADIEALIPAPAVTSVNGRSGDVQLETDDILRAGAAPIVDAHFGGFITAPTAWDFRANSDQVATTAFVQLVINQLICGGSVVTSFNGRTGPIILTVDDVNAAYAAAVAPDWPTAPNPALGDASNRIATTLFVDDSVSDLQQQLINYINSGAGVDLSSYAPLASPNFSGTPTAPTAATGVSTGQLATTAFVHNAVVAATTGVASFNTRTGAVTLLLADVTNAGGAPLANPIFTGIPAAPTAVLHNSSTQLATTAYVQGELAALPPPGVSSFNTRTGAIVLTTADVTGAGGAPTASPALTGVPTAPTAAAADSSTTLATTAFVHGAISALGTTVQSFNGRTGAITLLGNDISAAGGALLAGPAFTGAPTTPTATVGTSTTQIASTAFVQAAIASMAAGVTSFNTRTGAITLTLADVTGAGGAPLASPGLSGVPTAPTAAQTSNDTTLATTAFVKSAIAAGGVASFNSRTGAVTLQANDVSAVGGALLAGPAFTGVPTAPTAAANTNTTQLATTAFVMAQLATTGGVTSFNGRAGAVTLSLADVTGAGGAPLAGPAFTGVPSAPTAAAGTNTTQLATTAFVHGYLPLTGGTITGGLNLNASPGITMTSASGARVSLNLIDGGNASISGGINFGIPSSGNLYFGNTFSGTSLELQNDGSFIFNGGVGGAYKTGGGAWLDVSDSRIKTVTGDYELGLGEILRVQPVRFVYKGNDARGEGEPSTHARVADERTPFVGFVADAVMDVFPEMVTVCDGFIDGNKVSDLKQLDVSSLVYALVNAVKTLATRVSRLEASGRA
jgi:hypothetical protein